MVSREAGKAVRAAGCRRRRAGQPLLGASPGGPSDPRSSRPLRASQVYVPQIAGLPGGEGHAGERLAQAGCLLPWQPCCLPAAAARSAALLVCSSRLSLMAAPAPWWLPTCPAPALLPRVPAGWLISSSRGLLNLWEASPSAGRGEPALMCMHSQVGRPRCRPALLPATSARACHAGPLHNREPRCWHAVTCLALYVLPFPSVHPCPPYFNPPGLPSGRLQPSTRHHALTTTPPSPQPHPHPGQGTDYTSVCLDADRASRMLVGASQDRAGCEWLTCYSLDVETLLVRVRVCSCARVCVCACVCVCVLEAGLGRSMAEWASIGGAPGANWHFARRHGS